MPIRAHDTSNSAFLSAAPAKHTESSDYFLGTTVDQLAAKELGRETQLASLELAMDLNPLAGVCSSCACVYQNCLSWSSPTTLRRASARRLRASVRRGRQSGRAPRGVAQAGQPA